MSEAVGIVVAIGVGIVTLMTILAYIQMSRFFEVTRTQVTRFVDSVDRLEKNYSVALKKLGDASDQFGLVVSDFREKMANIERSFTPAAQNLDKALTDAAPLLKSLSGSSDDIRTAVVSIKRTASDLADVADGVHEVVMPVINTLRSIVSALSEGFRALRKPRR